MTEQEALIRRVCLTPADDLPRLIYADWLGDQGERDRAEFIRVQIEADKLDRIVTSAIYAPGPPQNVRTEFSRLCELRQRERELKDVLRMPLWVGEQPVQARFFGAVTRRGFFDSVTCTAAQWLAHGPAIVQQQPITRVVLSDRKPVGPLQASINGIVRSTWSWDRLPALDRHAENLKPCIFDHIKGGCSLRDGRVRAFNSRQEADVALSAAALLWARTEAGLEGDE